MAKVLISFLGVGNSKREYRKAKYKIDDSLYETPFISAALTKHLNIDRKIIIGTSKSMWEEFYRFFAETKNDFKEDIYFKIAQSIDNVEFNNKNENLGLLEKEIPNLKIIQIKYGLNEDELRFNLNKILELENFINIDDHLYIDVTHGFRTFPLLTQYAINYLKLISKKEIIIKGYYYGMLEAINELGYAPVVDMSIINDLNELLIGASQFKNNLSGQRLSKLLQEKSGEAAKKINNFSNALSINYSHEIKKQIQQLNNFNFISIPKLERKIVEQVFKSFINIFKDINKASDFQLLLAEYYYKKQLFGTSYIFLTEAIITKVVEELVSPEKVFKKDARENAKLNIFKYNIELNNIYKTVNKIRNNIAHALDLRHDTYHNDINSLNNHIKKVKNIFQIK